MITTEIVISLGFAPWNTHGCNQRALKNFVLMRQQYATAQPIHAAGVRCFLAKVKFRIHNRSLPLPNIRLAM